MKKYFFLSLFLTYITILHANPVSIAVVDFDSGSFCTVQEAAVMTSSFRNEMVRAGRATIIDRSHTEALKAEMVFQMSDWVNPSRIRQAGNLLGVDYFIFGNFGIMGGTGYLQVQMTEVDSGRIIHSAQISLNTWQEFERRVQTFAREFSDKIPMPNGFLGTWSMSMEREGNLDHYSITFLSETSCRVVVSGIVNGQRVSQEANGIYSYDDNFFRLSVNYPNPSIPSLSSIQWTSALSFNRNRTAFNILVRTVNNIQARVTFMKE